MPIFEFICPEHGKFEKIIQGQPDIKAAECPGPLGKPCLNHSPRVEFSVPAKRNPEHGIQH